MKKLYAVLIWFILLPALSLVFSYACIRVGEQDISRFGFAVVSVAAIAAPIITFAYGILHLFNSFALRQIIIASAASSCFWVVVAALANRALPSNVDINLTQSVISIISFTVIASVFFVFMQWLMQHRGRTQGKS